VFLIFAFIRVIRVIRGSRISTGKSLAQTDREIPIGIFRCINFSCYEIFAGKMLALAAFAV
jgi:hypothetical protein